MIIRSRIKNNNSSMWALWDARTNWLARYFVVWHWCICVSLSRSLSLTLTFSFFFKVKRTGSSCSRKKGEGKKRDFFIFIQPTVGEHILLQPCYGLTLVGSLSILKKAAIQRNRKRHPGRERCHSALMRFYFRYFCYWFSN